MERGGVDGGGIVAPSAWVTYAFRKSILDKERTFRLSPKAILIEEEGKDVRSVPYEAIIDVHLSFVRSKYRDYLRCELKTADGEKVFLQNQHFKGLASFEERTPQFRAFLEALHGLLASHPRQRTYRSGSLAMWLVSIIGMVLLVGLGVVGVVVEQWVLLLIPAIGGYRLLPLISRTKPGSYEPRQLPGWMR